MRYPYGTRESLAEACDAAREAVKTTGRGLRYRVYLSRLRPANSVPRVWVFSPARPMGPNDEAVRL